MNRSDATLQEVFQVLMAFMLAIVGSVVVMDITQKAAHHYGYVVQTCPMPDFGSWFTTIPQKAELVSANLLEAQVWNQFYFHCCRFDQIHNYRMRPGYCNVSDYCYSLMNQWTNIIGVNISKVSNMIFAKCPAYISAGDTINTIYLCPVKEIMRLQA